MTTPFGWVGTRADGSTVVFEGAAPNAAYASQFASLTEIDTDADLDAAKTVSRTPSAPVVPQVISDWQFFQQLAVMSVITQAEALAAVQTGAIPSEMQPLVDGLSPDQKFAAEMKISGATLFNRNDALTLALGAAKGWSPAQIDALWTAAAGL